MNKLSPKIDEDDKALIMEVFNSEIIPKLKRLGARMGNLNCVFAGDRYKNWDIRFESSGSGFDITDFEYNEKGAGVDLDL